MQINHALKPADLVKPIERLFTLAAGKVADLDKTWDPKHGTPVFTVNGRYTTRGWTEWTQGFVYGCAILTFDATGDKKFLDIGRKRTVDLMLPHVTHVGVHDHGFNNLSTYGNLRRLMLEGKIKNDPWELAFYEQAIKASGAVQAARWSSTNDTDAIDGGGYVYSFNGPHSLFVDTMRTIRIMALSHRLGHVLMGENDAKINLLGRMIKHALATHKYVLFHGKSTHTYDVRGRTAHEAVFNRNDGRFRCRATQQGYSPFSTWTRGLAWAMLGYAEELELLRATGDADIKLACGLGKAQVLTLFETAARETCDHYMQDCATFDGITYWDDGAPGLAKLGDWKTKPADPYNAHEPVDASASAIAAQGLIRLGTYLGPKGKNYVQAGYTVAKTLLNEPYIASDKKHQGILLHAVYHRPNGWDNVPAGQKVPCNESAMWGDYHLLELANLIKRIADGGAYPTFF
jgi:unsaturated chondroitin disaccharide hydrolase